MAPTLPMSSFSCVATAARTVAHASARVKRRDTNNASPSAHVPDKEKSPKSIVSRRLWTTGVSLALTCAALPETVFAADYKPTVNTNPGITRVVLKTASILPETAAEYLVQTLGLRLLTPVEDPAVARGRVVVAGSWGVRLELRGGGDEPDIDAGEIGEPTGLSSSPRVTTLLLASDNPAKARNTALRNGATSVSQNSGPASGERCSGDAFLGCAVQIVGLNVVFVKTSVKKGVPALVRVGIETKGKEAEAYASILQQNLLNAVSLTSRDGNKTGQPGLVERAAEDPRAENGEVLLVPSNAGNGGGLQVGGAWRPSDAWRVIAVGSEKKTTAPGSTSE